MGEMGRATCMICGRELPIIEMESTFTGRRKYRCHECVSNGDKQVRARICASFNNGFAKKIKEQNGWR